MRFEKSLDPENTVRGLARAIELFRQVCPGIRIAGGVADNRAASTPAAPIALPVGFVSRKLGKEVSQQEIAEILGALGFGIAETSRGLLAVTVPTWRATKDISVKDDLVEEIGRMVGYAEIVPTPPLVASVVPPTNPRRAYLRHVRAQLAAQGFTEVHNYSFLNEAEFRRFGFDAGDHVGVRNPIAAELTHLRRSLLPGIFKNIAGNVRNFPEFRLFEIGTEIHPRGNGELPEEITHAVAVIYGAQADAQDFFELKRVAECLFPSAQLAATDARPYEHPTRTAAILWHGNTIGRQFELHPALLQEAGIEGRAVLFDVDLQLAQKAAATQAFTYMPPRKYPTSGFDLSAVADLHVPVSRIEEQLTRLGGSDLASIEFVRQYVGSPLAPGQKSVSYHLEVGALDRTLTTEEVAVIRNRIVQGMQEAGFEIRGVE
jgi:phenylalanyl-tRNA synthetase beta chain